MNANFILKVTDATLSDIQKALQAAGIQLKSIIEIFREEATPSREEQQKK